MQDRDRSLTPNNSPALPNEEWELSELIQLVTAELDQAQDTLILKSQNRRLSMMVNQLNLDLQVDVRRDPSGRLLFRTSAPGQAGATVLKLGFTPALDTQVQETRKSVDLETDELEPLSTLPDIQDSEIQRLKTVGIHSVNDLFGAAQTPAMLTEISLKSGVDEARLRLWRQWPFISDIQPGSGAPGSMVVIDGGNLGSINDTVEVYFQDRLARMVQRTSTRLTVEMPRGITGSGPVVAKVKDQRTNTKTWRADVVDLVVQTITLKTPEPLRVQQAIAFQATLVNQGTLSIAKIPVRWTVTTTSSRQPPVDYSLLARPNDDDFPTFPRTIIQETYLHGPLEAQATSRDPSLEFIAAFTEPGTYWVSVIIDPDNTLEDQSPTNNRFMVEFVVQPPPPPPPEFNPSPNQFAPKTGRPGDRITLQGRNFDQGTPTVLFGTVPAAIISATATQIVVRVPSISPRSTPITVQTPVGTSTTQDTFAILSSSYYGSGQAIGGNLL